MASSGSNIAPIFLRLGLGLTFLWAGWAKVFHTVPVQGEQAAILANLGVIEPGSPGVTPAPNTLPVPADPVPASPKVTPPEPPTAPPAATPPAPTPAPAATPDPKPADAPASDPGDGPPPARELAPTTTPDAAPTTDSKPTKGPSELIQVQPLASVIQVSLNLPTITYTASDFPEPRNVRQLYMIVFGITDAAAPKADDTGKTPMPLLPAAVNQGRWPVYLAWAAALSELVGGTFLLLGFLGRLSGFMIAGVMATAMWLTQIGPAIQAGNARFGFLPAHGFWDTNAAGVPHYMTPLWILMLLCASMAVVVLGSGALSIDSLFHRPRGAVTKDEA